MKNQPSRKNVKKVYYTEIPLLPLLSDGPTAFISIRHFISSFAIPCHTFRLDLLTVENTNLRCTKVRLCSEGVTKLFPKGSDVQNNIFLHPHGKRKPAPELHLSALNY